MTASYPALLGLGVAIPAHFASQRQTLALGLAATLEDAAQASLISGLYGRAGVERRGSVLLKSETAQGEALDQAFFPSEEGGAWPTTAARMRAFEASAAPLALHAARRAMVEAGTTADQITDLIMVSCTGLGSPGVDVALMTGLGLLPGVRRANIGFMGCHGAIVALRTAAALASARVTSPQRPTRVLAVCVELCSLHLQRTSRADRHVSNALFADGCAAMIVGNAVGQVDRVDTQAPAWFRIVDSSSMLFASSTSAMGWQIGDHGFEMTLDRSVPALLEQYLGEWVWPWVRSHLGTAAGPGDVRWGIHPGGPRVLDAVAAALGLGADDVRESRMVLRDYGNMSSPTVLFIVERMRGDRIDRRPIVLLAFGPGLTGEAALLQPMHRAL